MMDVDDDGWVHVAYYQNTRPAARTAAS